MTLFVASPWVPLFMVADTSNYQKFDVVVKSIGRMDRKKRVKRGDKMASW